jgi:hypothetical protein
MGNLRQSFVWLGREVMVAADRLGQHSGTPEWTTENPGDVLAAESHGD